MEDILNTNIEYIDDKTLEARTPFKRNFWQKKRVTGDGPPYVKVGRRCVYKWHEVVAWMESQAVKP